MVAVNVHLNVADNYAHITPTVKVVCVGIVAPALVGDLH